MQLLDDVHRLGWDFSISSLPTVCLPLALTLYAQLFNQMNARKIIDSSLAWEGLSNAHWFQVKEMCPGGLANHFAALVELLLHMLIVALHSLRRSRLICIFASSPPLQPILAGNLLQIRIIPCPHLWRSHLICAVVFLPFCPLLCSPSWRASCCCRS